MYLENGRALLQGILLLIFDAIAYWVSLPIGLALIAIIGILRIQESKTNWCISDPFLRWLGLKKKSETLQSK